MLLFLAKSEIYASQWTIAHHYELVLRHYEAVAETMILWRRHFIYDVSTENTVQDVYAFKRVNVEDVLPHTTRATIP